MIAILGHYPSQFLDLETFLYFLLHLVLVDYMFSYAANTKQEMMFKDRACIHLLIQSRVLYIEQRFLKTSSCIYVNFLFILIVILSFALRQQSFLYLQLLQSSHSKTSSEHPYLFPFKITCILI